MPIDFQGSIPQRGGPAAPRLNLAPRPYFTLKHHPARWGLVGGRIRPILGQIRSDPGVGGVDKDTAPPTLRLTPSGAGAGTR